MWMKDTRKKSEFHITLPKIGDELAIGTMHVQGWKEAYLNSELGITEEYIDDLIGHYVTDTAYRKNTLVEALKHPDRVFYRVVKNERGEIVGFFHCAKNETDNVLEGIYLLNEAKGAGVGTQLMNEFIAWSDKDKPYRLEVFSFNTTAINFYKKFGFKEVAGSPLLYKNKIPYIEMVRRAEN